MAFLSKKRKVAQTKVDGNKFYSLKDASSIIKMNNSTLAVTTSGARLTRGKFVGDGAVKLDLDENLCLGQRSLLK